MEETEHVAIGVAHNMGDAMLSTSPLGPQKQTCGETGSRILIITNDINPSALTAIILRASAHSESSTEEFIVTPTFKRITNGPKLQGAVPGLGI